MGGSLIDTGSDFQVKNEFVATTDYATFWKIRTVLTQGNDSMVFEKDCRDYLTRLNTPIEGGHAVVFANWDNSEGRESFELELGQTPGSCSSASFTVKDVVVTQYGSIETPPEEEDDDEEEDDE